MSRRRLMALVALAITALGLSPSARAAPPNCSPDEGVWVPMGTMGPGMWPDSDGDPLWTGEMVLFPRVWTDIGQSYDTQTDQTNPYTQLLPNSRMRYTKIWTGSRMIVWGGTIGYTDATNTGGIYDPVTDTWTPTSTVGAPAPRVGHTAVWTGSRMLIWGGQKPMTSDVLEPFGDGAMYDPETDSWTPMATSGAPLSRTFHSAVWTGSRMIVWGGAYDFFEPDVFVSRADGARFNPNSNTWSAISPTSAPSPRYRHSAVWTGTQMIIWGGNSPCCGALDTGGRYSPGTDTWTPVGATGTPPPPLNRHTAVWSGSRMIIWYGYSYPAAGALYNPMLDTWTPMALEGAPPSTSPGAAWTGLAMAVAGGLYFPSTEADADGDGYAICDGDCHDGIDTVSPEGIEVCNGLDDDCSGSTDDGDLCGSDGDPCTADLCLGHQGCTYGDTDGDQHKDQACGGDDCNDANASTWAAPEEVSSLELLDPHELQCESQDLTAGPGTLFDLVRGVLAGVNAPNYAAGVCQATGNDNRFDLWAVPLPAPGTAQWFLIRARNICGSTSWGSPQADAGMPPCP